MVSNKSYIEQIAYVGRSPVRGASAICPSANGIRASANSVRRTKSGARCFCNLSDRKFTNYSQKSKRNETS